MISEVSALLLLHKYFTNSTTSAKDPPSSQLSRYSNLILYSKNESKTVYRYMEEIEWLPRICEYGYGSKPTSGTFLGLGKPPEVGSL